MSALSSRIRERLAALLGGWPRRYRGLVAWALFLTLTGIGLGQIAAKAGWPSNHEYDSFFQRAAIYRLHLLQGDVLPLWSTSDNLGLGSPQPAQYHKLFYLTYAALSLVLAPEKTVMLGAIALWTLIGAWGMVALCRALGLRYAMAVLGGLMLVCANYTVTDWLIRGAMAEYAAAMLIPWALTGWVRSLRLGRLTILLGVHLGLIFLSHSVMAYYMVLLLAGSAVSLLALRRLPLTLFAWRTASRSVLACVLVCLPYIAPMLAFGREYDMRRIMIPFPRPIDLFHRPAQYLWDTVWRWGARWDAYTVQLDTAVLALLGLSCLGLLMQRLRGRPLPSADAMFTTGVISLAGITGLALLAQLTVAEPAYRLIPGADFIQFPWRLLGVITPGLIALALAACQSLVGDRPALACGAATLALMLVSWGAVRPITYSWLMIDRIDLDGLMFSSFGEYVPTRAGHAGNVPHIRQLLPWQKVAIDEETAGRETLVRRFRVTAQKPARVALPLFSSPFHGVRQDGQEKDCLERQGLPGFCAVDVPAGESVVEVAQPTLWRVMRHGLTRLRHGLAGLSHQDKAAAGP